MRRVTDGVVLALALSALAAPRAVVAQIDYRNLDDDRPTRVEDAYPVERFAFEFLVPYAFERERSGTAIHASILELAYGLLPNAHVGFKAPLAATRQAGMTDWGLSGLKAFALYNFNTEGALLPALSLRADAVVPVGSLGGDETQLAVKALATRSWGRARLHLNGAVRLTPDAAAAVVEALERWWAGAALDRTFFRQSVLLVGEVTMGRAIAAAALEVNGGLGLRWQWRPTTVFDVGIARRLKRNVGPDYALTLGISSAFAIAALMPNDLGR
ncbi:MAG: hypothetical protein HY337_00185 [Gemmatimonadetes bacterium]|nr:hypothetical protein [Gemmatimonadota bacterium]